MARLGAAATVDTALKWTVEWYKHQQQGGDVRAKSMEQIRDYDRLWES